MPEKWPKIEPKITTPHTPESFKEQIKHYEDGEGFDIYARYGYPKEREWEKKLAEKVGVEDTAVMNSGMAAIHTAIEAEEYQKGDTILCSRDVYECTKDLYDDLKKRGIIVKLFDPGDSQKLADQIRTLNPRSVIFETVANEKKMNMVDMENVLDVTKEINEKRGQKTEKDLMEMKLAEKKLKHKYTNLSDEDINKFIETLKEYEQTKNYFCFRKVIARISNKLMLSRREVIDDLAEIARYVMKNKKERLNLIIDNTLPSPELYNPLKNVNPEMLTDIIVVESGTKHYQMGQDKVTLGVAYSNNPKKIKEIKKARTRLGTYLQPINLAEIPENSLHGMKEKMKCHGQNALALARDLEKFPELTVYHPNLESHPDKDLADKFAPEGIASLFYVDLKNMSAMEFAKKVYEESGEKIKLGGSFGHPDTWIAPFGEKTIRIAAGSESPEEFEKVREWFRKALR
jgi:cystathionine beta-lyase/cystathionine gamma-synthase